MCGFRLIDESWKSCYWNDELQIYLVVYVDDFSACGDPENHKVRWSRIEKRIDLGTVEPMTHFLGCERRVFECDGTKGVENDMREFWLNAVKAYKELAPRNPDGGQIELGRVDSPYASDADAGKMSKNKDQYF